MQISTSSLEYVKVQVTRNTNQDPTGDSVYMAFVADGVTPSISDWKSASWETVNGKYIAKCLVGSGGVISLSVGWYVVWVKITDSPEIPVRKAGLIEVI